MTTVYLSSTYNDLKSCREAVYYVLRQMGCDVKAMEDYVAADERPVNKCLQDVASCDLYLGLFAWRYGYIPDRENPEQKSITELEYRQAKKLGKPCLVFLLDEDAPWSAKLMDSHTKEGKQGELVTDFRQELQDNILVSFFTDCEHLAQLVGPAVHVWKSSQASFAPQSRRVQEQLGREQRLLSLFADHRGFLQDRLESFIGRQTELADIRERVHVQMRTGGYVTISGQAGQGKSSVIAKLVEEHGVDNVAYHFIPFNPGPDHQVGLLRNLMARLILKYNLSDLYIASESRAALRDYFPKVLQEVVAKGGQEVIFLDGLDQLEEDANGVRDLSFLPTNTPVGVVFVLGTRPNDALKPLKLLKPHYEYQLPGLRREDFDLLLQHRQVYLQPEVADQLYGLMQENALYLNLVAKELQEKGASSPQEMIARIAHNPENIFSLSIERLKRKPLEWREVLKPILGVLLVSREPLSIRQIRQILQQEDDRLRDGIVRLGGLIVESGQVGQGRYSLYHLKLQDYLRQDENAPQKDYVFATDEEEHFHASFAKWCEKGDFAQIWKDVQEIGEQQRREYARQHYITHLYLAHEWQQVFAVLDEGTYGQAKERYDPSTRSYSQDLDLGRRATTWSGWTLEEGLDMLPRLWRYTLLRCSMRSQADHYPLVTFQLMLLLKREQEVLGIVELLTKPLYKVEVLLEVAKHMTMVGQNEKAFQLFFRADEIAYSIADNDQRVTVLRELGIALVKAHQLERAEMVAYSIVDNDQRVIVLRELGIALVKAHQLERAEKIWAKMESIARSTSDIGRRVRAMLELATALVKVGRLKRAEAVARSTKSRYWRDAILCGLGTILIKEGHYKRAEEVAYSIKYSSQRDIVLSELVTALIKEHKLKRAELVTRSIEDSYQRATALSELVFALVEVYREEQAEEIWAEAQVATRSIKGSYWRAKALRELAITLVEVHREEQAEEIWTEVEVATRSIEDKGQRSKALRELAITLVEVHREEQAEMVARSSTTKDQRSKALRDLANALIKAHQLERAEAIVRSIEENYQRVKALVELALALVEVHREEQAEEIWAEVKVTTSSIKDNDKRAIILSEIGITLFNAKQLERAQRVCSDVEAFIHSTEQSSQRGRALSELAITLTKVHQLEQAEEVIRSIVDNYWRAKALGELALALVEVHREEQAEEIWVEAEVTTRSIERSYWSSIAMEELVVILVKTHQLERAEAIARSVEGESQRAKALSELAIALVEVHQEEQAKVIAYSIKESSQRARALEVLAVALAKTHQLERAKAVIRSIDDNYWRARALRELAIAFVEVHQEEQAEEIWAEVEEVARSTEDNGQRAQSLSELGIALVKMHQLERAEAVARSIKRSSYWRARLLRELAIALVEAHQLERAEEIWVEVEAVARSISSTDQRMIALKELGFALVKAHNLERAEAVAYSIGDNRQRTEVLELLSNTFASSGKYELSLRVVKRAWLLVETRKDALQCLPLAMSLLFHKPEIGTDFYEGFKWVDAFMRG